MKVRNKAAAVLATLSLVFASMAAFAPAASAGSIPSQVRNYAGARVKVDYNLGQGPYEYLYEKIGPKDPWKSKATDDVDRFKTTGKRCVIVFNPVPGKVKGTFYTLDGKWYTISSLSVVEVYAYGKNGDWQCTANVELPQKK